jgi:hypothetical protein
MAGYTTNIRNKTFSGERIELDGCTFTDCAFEKCIFVLERGETQLARCTFENCQLVLQGRAYTVAQIIRTFTHDGPLKVLDMDEPLFGKKEP